MLQLGKGLQSTSELQVMPTRERPSTSSGERRVNCTPLPVLVTALRTRGSYDDRLSPVDSTTEQVDIVVQAVEATRRLLATARARPPPPRAPSTPPGRSTRPGVRTAKPHHGAYNGPGL
ncbi:hypothetical protein [Streptomyces virginiae]